MMVNEKLLAKTVTGNSAKDQLRSVVANMATDQVSFVELKRPMGAFIDLVTESTNPTYTNSARKAVTLAADDFRGMLYAMQLFEELLGRPAPEDVLLRTMEARALIQVFFLDVRSIFDYMLMATVIVFGSEIDSSGSSFWKGLQTQLRDKGYIPSFSKAKPNLLQNEAAAIACFGAELVQAWLDCNWFDEFNRWRNGITHAGFFLTLKNENPDVFFIETIAGDFPLQHGSLSKAMFDGENAVSFKVFSGLYSGLMLPFLNQWSEQIRKKANLPVGNRAYVGRGGTIFDANVKLAMTVLP